MYSLMQMFSAALSLLLLAVHGAAARDPSWSLCGIVELPPGLSVAQPAVAGAGGRLEVGSDGVWRCYCHKNITNDQELLSDVGVRFNVADEEHRIVGYVSTAVSPCLSAVCSDWTLSDEELMDVSNHSLELHPKECNSAIKSYKSGDTVYSEVLDHIPVNCEGSASIILSELYHLSGVGESSSVDDVPVTIKRIIDFDIRSCVDTAEANRRRYSKLVFQTTRRHISHGTSHKRHIKKRDNNPPTFSKQYYNVEVAENVPPGTAVTTVQASDPDSGINGNLAYSMKPIGNSNSADYFQLHPLTGVMTTTGVIDREMMSSHTFHVTAADSGGEMQTVSYTITVTDENDNSPRFQQNYFREYVDEDQQQGDSILSITVMDDDEGTNSEISFTIENNTGNAFSIRGPVASGETTQLTLEEQLDFETLSFYVLTIVAYDGGDPQNNASARVEIVVRDVVDNHPQFNQTMYSIDVLENTTVDTDGTELFTIHATTLDSPSIASIQYFIIDGNFESKFVLDSNTGVLTLIDDLDYEQTSLYVLTVQAQTHTTLQASVSVKINVINVNDHAPIFSWSMYTVSVSEGVDRFSNPVVTVHANDMDEGRYGEITYHIEETSSIIRDNFKLNSSTGVITAQTIFDYETQTIYVFHVVAEDGGIPPRSNRVLVTVHVDNINDEIPVFVSLEYNATILENSGIGVSVAQVEAVDADTVSLEYYIVSGDPRNYFSIEGTSGLVTTAQSLNREEDDFYVIEISANDGMHSSHPNTLVYVTVEDANDRPPLFILARYSTELPELTPINTTVFTVEAVDEDEGSNSDVTYSSTDIPDTFHIDAESGVITLVKSLDYEEEESYVFQVWATDHGDMPLSSTAVVQVIVVDENDHTPVFDTGPRAGTVRENSPSRTSILHLSATDDDSGSNGELSFTITGDNQAVQAFSIDQDGVIRTRHPLDRELVSSYHLVIEVRDGGNPALSSTTSVEVQVDDVIDDVPRFSLVAYETTIATETPANTVLVRVLATTRDLDSSILYSIVSGANSTLFRINQRSGAISAATRIRPAIHAGDYHLHINAQHVHLSATVPVTITILRDIRIPRLKPLTLYFNIFTSLLQPTTALGAVSLDGPHEGQPTFSLNPHQHPRVQRYFSIDSVSGAIAVTSAVQSGHYRLQVNAASPTGNGTGVVHVYVHTISNATLENAVIVEFGSGSELEFASVMIENFAAALTEIIPCTRDQIEIIGVQETQNGKPQVAFAVWESDFQRYISTRMILDQLQANEGSARLSDVTRFGSEICTNEPCPNFQLCSPAVEMYRYGPQESYKVLQSTERVHISHPFSDSFTCHCPPGFDLQGLCSIETNSCDPSPCHFDAPCHSLHGDYYCECPPFTGGKDCSLVCPSPSCTPCLPDRCLHGSECQESQDLISYTCASCPWPDKYRGPNCELTSVHISSAGYIALPSLGSVVTTTIAFRFSTVSPNGSLLYTGRLSGSHDMLAIELVRGQLRATVSLGKGPVSITTRSQRKLNDGEWHSVRIQLHGHLQRLTVLVTGCSSSPSHLGDAPETCLLEGQVATQKKSLDVNTLLYFGGIEPHIPRITFLSSFPFEGCLADVVIDDRIVDLGNPIREHGTSIGCGPLDTECPEGRCLDGECVTVWNGTVCHCEGSPECQENSNPVSLNNGYVRLRSEQGFATTVEYFTMAFRTRQSDATLVQFGEVASVELQEGSVVYHQDTPPLTITLTLETAANDGLWHTVKLSTTGGETKFSLDSSRISTTYSDAQTFPVTSIILGTADTNTSHRYDGCLADFIINIQRVNLVTAIQSNTSEHYLTDSDNAEPGCGPGSQCGSNTTECPANRVCENTWRGHTCVCETGFVAGGDEGECFDPCDPNPCENGGVCVPGDPFLCECSEGFRGPTCALSQHAPCDVGFHSPPSCAPCRCNPEGVGEDVCESNGRCLCDPSLHVFNPRNDLGCQPCDCHVTGSADDQCSRSTGQCTCLPHVTGRQCDRCEDGYAGMDEEGCKEAKVVRGMFTLQVIPYSGALDRDGSQEKQNLISSLTNELKVTLGRYALVGQQDVAITALTNRSGLATAHYTVSSYSPYPDLPIPDDYHHILASVLQTMFGAGWVGSYQVVPASHFLLIECNTKPCSHRCLTIQTSADNPQRFACDLCPTDHTLDGIICRKNVDETCLGKDTDRDGVSDACDNCPYVFNPLQREEECAPPTDTKVCPASYAGGVLWSMVQAGYEDTKPCAPPSIGYAKRPCLSDGVWGEVDHTSCISVRGQQFVSDAESLRARRVLDGHRLLFLASEAISLTAAPGVTGGDLSAVGRLWSEMIRVLVEGARLVEESTEQKKQLLKALSTTASNLLAPRHSSLWTPVTAAQTGFSPRDFPSALERMTSLFRVYHSAGVTETYLQVKAIFSAADTISGDVIYVDSHNNTSSSVDLPLDLTQNVTDIIIGSYPTLSPLLPPASSNFTVASAVLSVQVWGEQVSTEDLPTPITLSLAHSRKVYSYSEEDAKCVFWQDTERSAGWSSDGCEVTKVNLTHTTCRCRHLTAFAALLPSASFEPIRTDSHLEDYHPGIFTYVVLVVVCILLLIAVITLWVIRSIQSLHTTVHKNLVLALLLTTAVFVVGIDRTESMELCVAFAIALDFFIISSFFWMLVGGVVIARLLLHPPPRTASCLAAFFIVAGLWTVPLLLCAIPVGIVAMASNTFAEDFGYPHYCLIAPNMVSVLMAPAGLLMVVIVVVLVVVAVLMLAQKSKKGQDGQTRVTPGALAMTKNRARRHLCVLAVILSLFLLIWGSGLLTVYGYVFPDPTRSVLEIAFAILYGALGGFLFIILCFNRKVLNALRSQFQSKDQPDSLRTTAGSSSFLSRLRFGSGRGQTDFFQLSVKQHRRADPTSPVLVRMETLPPEPPPVQRSTRDRTRPLRAPKRSTTFPRSQPTAHRKFGSQPPPAHARVAAVPVATVSTSGEADVDTDGTSTEAQPWYREQETLPLSPPTTDIDYPYEHQSEHDDSSRADPSGVSTCTHDLEEGGGGGDEGSVGGSESSITISELCGQARETPDRELEAERQRDLSRQEVERIEREEEEEQEAILRDQLCSPQASDPMWYRRGSGCEEIGIEPFPYESVSKTLSLQRSVKWADENNGELTPPTKLHSPRHSDASYGSSVKSHSQGSPSSQRSSRQASPKPKSSEVPGYLGSGGLPSGVYTPPLSPVRSPPEGKGAMVAFPSPHRTRQLPGKAPPSPTSQVSSASQQSSVLMTPTRSPSLQPRGAGVGQSPGKVTQRLPSHDYHCNGPSAHENNQFVRQNADGSHTLQSLV